MTCLVLPGVPSKESSPVVVFVDMLVVYDDTTTATKALTNSPDISKTHAAAGMWHHLSETKWNSRLLLKHHRIPRPEHTNDQMSAWLTGRVAVAVAGVMTDVS